MIRMLVSKVFTFDSCHMLPGYDGKCKRLHGHTYKLVVVVEHVREDSGDYVEKEGSDEGMVVDFSVLKSIVNATIIDKVDHYPLHEVFDFRTTAENLVMWMRGELLMAFAPHAFRLVKLRLYETPDSYVEVYSD